MEQPLLFTWVDYTALGLVLLSILFGLLRGFMKEAVSLASWIIALWLGFHFYPELAAQLKSTITHDTIRPIVAFLVIFLAAIILGALCNRLLSLLVKKTGLTGTDRLLGILFGGARGVLLVVFVIIFAKHTQLPNTTAWKTAWTVKTLSPIAKQVQSMLPSLP